VNCKTALEQLDLYTETDECRPSELEDHLNQCELCATTQAERSAFDSAIQSRLLDVAVPNHLEGALRALVDGELAGMESGVKPVPPTINSAPKNGASRRAWLRVLGSTAALAIIAVVAMVFNNAAPPSTLDYQTVFESHLRMYHQPGTLPDDEFDGSFSLDGMNSRLSSMVQGPAFGIDLDGTTGHDASLFQFASNRESGVVIVMPTSAISDGPTNAIPSYHRRQLTWQADGLTYICFVHSGSPEHLRNELFGNLA